MDIVKARVYVTSKQVYDSGNLFGIWIKLCNYKSYTEFILAFKEIYHKDADPEIIILEWQNIPDCFLIDKKNISPKIFEYINLVASFDVYTREAFTVWLDLMSFKINQYVCNEFINLFALAYQGYFRQKEDFGRYHANEALGINNPDFKYHDYTRQIFENEFIHIDGFVFTK